MKYFSTRIELITGFVFAILFFVGVSASTCYGSIQLSNLQNNVIHRFEDNDFEAAVMQNNTTLEIGDALFGVFYIESLIAPVTNTAQLTPVIGSDPGVGPGTTFAGAFVTQVTNKTPNTTGAGPYQYEFGPATGLNASIWSSILGYTPDSAGTMVAVFQDSSDPRISNTIPGSGTDGVPLFEFGFAGVTGESWKAFAISDNPTLLTFPVSFNVSLSETANFTDTVKFSPFTISQFTNSLQMHGTGSISYDPNAGVGNFPLFSDFDFWLKPQIVPEPLSVLVWSGLALAACGLGGRRRID